jgi:hypothetical protein
MSGVAVADDVLEYASFNFLSPIQPRPGRPGGQRRFSCPSCLAGLVAGAVLAGVGVGLVAWMFKENIFGCGKVRNSPRGIFCWRQCYDHIVSGHMYINLKNASNPGA